MRFFLNQWPPDPRFTPNKFVEFGHDYAEILVKIDALSGFLNLESEKMILR